MAATYEAIANRYVDRFFTNVRRGGYFRACLAARQELTNDWEQAHGPEKWALLDLARKPMFSEAALLEALDALEQRLEAIEGR